jgi:hypothetical protein
MVVVSLILLWNTAGFYATVCRALCAEDSCPQAMVQSSFGQRSPSAGAFRSAANKPTHPDSRCSAHLCPGNCLAGSSQAQLRVESFEVHPPLATTTPAAPVLGIGARPGTHSPPGFTSGRSICQKLTLLRI